MNRVPVLTIDRIVDLELFEMPLATLLPASSLDALIPWRELFAGDHVDFATGAVRIAIQSHLVRVGGATILVDACVGEGKDRPLRPDWHMREGTNFLAALARAGCRPDHVDIVLCTHLHADHVGWNTRLESGRWRPTFPNARYIVGAEELLYWQDRAARTPEVNHGSWRDSVLPILEAGLIRTAVAGEQVADGAKVIPLPGHTLGQIGLEIHNVSGPDVVFCGDAIHSPVQVVYPEWASFLCDDPALAVETRRALIERAESSDLLLAPAHLRGAGAMRIKRHGARHAPVFCTCRGDPV